MYNTPQLPSDLKTLRADFFEILVTFVHKYLATSGRSQTPHE